MSWSKEKSGKRMLIQGRLIHLRHFQYKKNRSSSWEKKIVTFSLSWEVEKWKTQLDCWTIDAQYTCVPGSPLTAKVKVKAKVQRWGYWKGQNWWYDWPYDIRKKKVIMRRFRRRGDFLSSSPLSNERRLSHFRCFLRRQCKLLHSKTTLQSIRLLPSRSCQGSKFEDTHSHVLRKVT